MEHDRENWTELGDNQDRKRQPGGYIWREKLEEAGLYILDTIIVIEDVALRTRLRKALDILRELEHYRGGTQ
jgi:hypothetical protein